MQTHTLDQTEARLRGLFEAAQGGDSQAYAAFLRAMAAHLRAFFRRRLSQWPDDVEDLVQETLLALHNQAHTWRRDCPLTAWVHAIAKYKLIDQLRRVGRTSALHDPLDETLDSAPHLFVASDEQARDAKRDVMQLLEGLPEAQRVAITQTKLEGRSVAECAAATGMSESAVKVYVHRGLKALATKMRAVQAQ
jgi:RNA polymerase sigma-70 factor (ECF subfamily)